MLLRLYRLGAPLPLFGLVDRLPDVGEACPFRARNLNTDRSLLGGQRDFAYTPWRPAVLVELPDVELGDAMLLNKFRQFFPDSVPSLRERGPDATPTRIHKCVQCGSACIRRSGSLWHICRLHSRRTAAGRHQGKGEYSGEQKAHGPPGYRTREGR